VLKEMEYEKDDNVIKHMEKLIKAMILFILLKFEFGDQM
jgi:hypothetical protein